MEDGERQAIVDEEHLKLLSLGYTVSAVMSLLFSFFGLLYAGMGAMLSAMPSNAPGSSGDPPPAFVGMIFGTIGVVMFVMLLSLAIAKFRVASQLKKRQSRTFCYVVAAITCLGMPWGTFLGVLTIMTLGRDSVSRQFD
jgi:hypothetical protein